MRLCRAAGMERLRQTLWRPFGRPADGAGLPAPVPVELEQVAGGADQQPFTIRLRHALHLQLISGT